MFQCIRYIMKGGSMQNVELTKKIERGEKFLMDNHPNLFLVFIFIQLVLKIVFGAFTTEVKREKAYWALLIMWMINCGLSVGYALILGAHYATVTPIAFFDVFSF